MKITATILLIILMLLWLLCIYFIKRNTKVRDFRICILRHIDSVEKSKIIEGATDKEILQMYEVLDASSYAKMLHSFKPLKVEYWFTEEELKIMGYESRRLD